MSRWPPLIRNPREAFWHSQSPATAGATAEFSARVPSSSPHLDRPSLGLWQRADKMMPGRTDSCHYAITFARRSITSLRGKSFHGGWPMVIVQQLRQKLPPGYVAAPRVHSGAQAEIDVAAFEEDDAPSIKGMSEGNGGVATAVWAPPAASLAVETEVPDFDEYEVRIYDAKRGRIWLRPSKSSAPRTKIDRSIAMPLWASVRRSFKKASPSVSSIS